MVRGSRQVRPERQFAKSGSYATVERGRVPVQPCTQAFTAPRVCGFGDEREKEFACEL